MAYHSTTGTAASSADFLVKLKDFLVTTCGWTLHDDGSATAAPYYVLRSCGESGVEDIYLQLINDSGTDRISVHAFLYWDAAAHTGAKEAYSSANTYLRTVDASPFLYWFYADLDHFFVVTKVVATYYGQYSGIIKRFWSGAIALTPGAGRRRKQCYGAGQRRQPLYRRASDDDQGQCQHRASGRHGCESWRHAADDHPWPVWWLPMPPEPSWARIPSR